MAVQFTKLSVSPEVVQTTGTSETAVMSQKAVTDALANAGGGSGGGSGNTSVTLTLNKIAIYSGSVGANSETRGILNKTNFSNTKSGGFTLTDDQYNTIQNAMSQNKRLLYSINGNIYEGVMTKSGWGGNYNVEILAFNTHIIAYKLNINTDKTLTVSVFLSGSNLASNTTLESITLI